MYQDAQPPAQPGAFDQNRPIYPPDQFGVPMMNTPQAMYGGMNPYAMGAGDGFGYGYAPGVPFMMGGGFPGGPLMGAAGREEENINSGQDTRPTPGVATRQQGDEALDTPRQGAGQERTARQSREVGAHGPPARHQDQNANERPLEQARNSLLRGDYYNNTSMFGLPATSNPASGLAGGEQKANMSSGRAGTASYVLPPSAYGMDMGRGSAGAPFYGSMMERNGSLLYGGGGNAQSSQRGVDSAIRLGNNPVGGSMFNMQGSLYDGGSFARGPTWGSNPVLSFHGSLYGGSMFGVTGALYSGAGSLYGGYANMSRPASLYSMFGSGLSMYGGVGGGSMYDALRPHTSLGIVRKLSLPGFTYTYPSSTMNGLVPGDTFWDRAEASMRESAPKPTASTARVVSSASVEQKKKTRSPLTVETAAATTTAPASSARAPTETKPRSQPERKTEEKRSNATEPAASAKPVAAEKSSTAPLTAAVPSKTTDTSLTTAQTIATIGIIEQTGNSTVRVTRRTKPQMSIVVGEAEERSVFDLTDVLAYDRNQATVPSPQLSSVRLTQMLQHYVAGHSTAVLVPATPEASASPLALVQAVGYVLFDLLAKAGNTHTAVTLTLAAVRGADAVKDLLQPTPTEKGKEVPQYTSLELGGSPLLGPLIMNLTPTSINDAAAWSARMAETFAAMQAEKDTPLIGSVALKQVRANHADANPDVAPMVLVSSLLILVSLDGGAVLRAIVEKAADKVPLELFRHAVGGPCVTVCCPCLRDDVSVAAALQLLSNVKTLTAVQNSYPRSGNVERFVTFTKSQYKALEAQAKAAAPGEQADVLQRNLERTRVILADTQELLQNPTVVEPRHYRTPKRDEAGAASQQRQQQQQEQKMSVPLMGDHVPSAETIAREVTLAQGGLPSVTKEQILSTLQTVVFVETDAAGYRVDLASQPPLVTIAENNKAYAVTEIVPCRAGQAEEPTSAVLTEAVAAFIGGYNTALLVLGTGAEAEDPYCSPAWSALRRLVRTGLEHPAQHKSLQVSFALLRGSGEALDLLPGDDDGGAGAAADWSKLIIAASPIFGPVIHNAPFHAIAEEADFEGYVDHARTRTGGRWGEDTLLHIVFTFFYSTGKDAFVASFLASFAGGNAAVYRAILEQRGPLYGVYRYAFSGTAATSLALGLDRRATAAQVAALFELQPSLATRQGHAVRSGSLTEFVRYTKVLFDKRRTRAAEATDPKEKAAQERLIGPMGRMLRDYERCLQDPAHFSPVAYAPDDAAPPSPRVASNSAATLPRDAAPTANFIRHTSNNNNTVTTSGPAPAAPAAAAPIEPPAARKIASARPDADSVTGEPRAERVDRVAVAPPRAAAAQVTAVRPHVPSPAPAGQSSATARNGEFATTTPRVVVLRDKAAYPNSEGHQIVVNDVAYNVDEILPRMSGPDAGGRYVAQSDSLRALSKCVDAALNCALVCASTVEVAPAQEAVWAILLELARAPLQVAHGAVKGAVFLDVSFTLVSASEMLVDLLADGAAAPRARTTPGSPTPTAVPLEICASPISGRIVGGVSLIRVTTVAELEQLFTKALNAAARHQAAIYRRGALLFGTIIQRHKLPNGDVSMAGIVGTLTGAGATPYAEVLERTHCVRRNLLSCVLGGPSLTVCLVNLGDATAGSKVDETMYVMQALSKKCKNLQQYSSSVRRFLRYAQASLERNRTKATSGLQNSKTEYLPKMIEEHQGLLIDFFAPHPAYLLTDRSASGALGDSLSMRSLNQRSIMSESKEIEEGGGNAKTGRPEASPRRARSPAASTSAARLHTVLFITEQRVTSSHTNNNAAGAGASPVATISASDVEHAIATLRDGATTLEAKFSEVVTRPSRSSVVRSEHLVQLVEQVSAGRAGSLLLYDVPGSNVAIPVVEKVIHGLIASADAAAKANGAGVREIYYTLAIMKDGTKVKDMSATGKADYVPCEIESSPFLGLAMRCVKLQKLTETAQFDLAFTTAVAEAKNERAVCVATVVLKEVTSDGKDVRFTSLHIGVSSDGATAYDSVAQDGTPAQHFFQRALGGKCYSVAVLGLSSKVDANEARKALELFEKLRSYQPDDLLSEADEAFTGGSVREYLEHSAKHEAQLLQENIKKAASSSEDEIKAVKTRLESLQRLRREAKRILSNPNTAAPPNWE